MTQTLPRRVPGASGLTARPAPLLSAADRAAVAAWQQARDAPPQADHGAAREALMIAAACCDDLERRNAETSALSFALQGAGQIVRRCWELAVRWEAGARRLQHDDPEAAGYLAMAAAELQDTIAGQRAWADAAWPLPEDELAAYRRSKGRQA